MRKYTLRITSICLVLVLLLSTFPLTAFAATTKYETAKDNVPVWSEASSKSTKVYRIEDEGTIVEVTSSKTNSAGNLWYKLTDGNWIFSGNVKKHSHMGIMCGRSTYSYAQKNSSSHTVTEKVPDLCLCGHIMGYETYVRDENHSFNSNNTCTKCGYKKPHTHKAVACGETKYSYTQNNDNLHTVAEKTPDLCSCGYVMGYAMRLRDEAHSFNSNNTCTKCGYKKVHKHEAVACGQATYSYAPKNASVHTVTTKMPDLCSCGHVMGCQTTTGDETHSFNSNNTCTKCGYKKVHKHEAVACGQATYSYAQKNASAHTVTTKMPDLCSCGHVMGYQTTTGDESHSFDSNNTCTKCSYKKVHTHKLDHLESAGSEYFTKDEYSHVFEEQLLELCSCGSALNKKLVQTTQRHEFDSSGKCVCGYTKETPTHTHKGIVCGDPFYSYTAKDREVHYVLEKTPNICECGTVVNFETLILKEESHRFENDICKDCNVEKSYGILDVEASQIIEQAVQGNYSDDVTLAGIVSEILVGEIPVVGTIADVRDVVADIQNDAGFWATAIDAAALIPVAGGIIKYADDASDASKALKSARNSAVRKAWKNELNDVMTGGSGISRNWTDAEISELLLKGKVSGYQGHHMKSVKGYSTLAGDPNNIQFLTHQEHLRAHNGNFKNITHGRFLP